MLRARNRPTACYMPLQSCVHNAPKLCSLHHQLPHLAQCSPSPERDISPSTNLFDATNTYNNTTLQSLVTLSPRLSRTKYIHTRKLNISYPPLLISVLVDMEITCRFIFTLKNVIHDLCICVVPINPKVPCPVCQCHGTGHNVNDT